MPYPLSINIRGKNGRYFSRYFDIDAVCELGEILSMFVWNR
jgi:hypothetical protein